MTATRNPAARPAKPAKSPSRGVRVEEDGRIVLRVGKNVTAYTCTEFPVGEPYDGRAFKLVKPDGEHYNVFLARNGQDDSCDCMGYVAHTTCKHRDSLRCLLSRGLLDDALAAAERAEADRVWASEQEDYRAAQAEHERRTWAADEVRL